ncbi:MAG: hypothetical protein K1000chlam4_00204 [Chlamydiae bacterium]|nr:hypothetical protein [Chlamydiota bacterium]
MDRLLFCGELSYLDYCGYETEINLHNSFFDGITDVYE